MTTIATTAEVAESFRGHLHEEHLATLRRAFALPSTLRGFILFLLGLTIIGSGLAVQVMLSAQIRQLEVENAAIRADVVRIEQRNAEIMWSISAASSLEMIEQRARALGFVPVEEPTFVVRAADAPTYFGNVSVPVDEVDHAATSPRMTQIGSEIDADMTWTSGLVSVVRQRVAESIEQLIR